MNTIEGMVRKEDLDACTNPKQIVQLYWESGMIIDERYEAILKPIGKVTMWDSPEGNRCTSRRV